MMAFFSHKRAEEVAARVEAGAAVSSAERIYLEEHLESCEACAARHQRLQALTDVLRTEPSETSSTADRALIATAVMAAAGERPGASLRPMKTEDWKWPALAGAAAAGMLSLAAVWYAGEGQTPSAEAPAAQAAAAPERRPASDASAASPRGHSPKVAAVPPSAEVDSPAGSKDSPRVDSMEAPCRGVRTDAAGPDAFDVLVADDSRCRLAIAAGMVRFHVDPRAEVRVEIETPSATVRVVGTVFRVSVGTEGTAVAVYRGAVEVDTRGGTRRVWAGRELVQSPRPNGPALIRPAAPNALSGLASFVGDPPPPPSRAAPAATASAPARQRKARSDVADLRAMLASGQTAEARQQALVRDGSPEYSGKQAELLTIVAESYVLEGELARAFETYKRVWRDGKRSSTAANAMMAAANLSMKLPGQAGRAAELYAEYAERFPQATLREQALVGRCLALDKAGQHSEAVACASAYLETYPDGHLRHRLRGLLP